MGAPRQFPLEYEEVEEKFKEYKDIVESGKGFRAEKSHFCAYLGVSLQDVQKLCKEPNQKNEPLARLFELIETWINGQLMTDSRWSGPNQVKGIFASKQSLAGAAYSDKQEVGISGKAEVEVKFNGPKGAFD